MSCIFAYYSEVFNNPWEQPMHYKPSASVLQAESLIPKE